jgi:hypothetical protein
MLHKVASMWVCLHVGVVSAALHSPAMLWLLHPARSACACHLPCSCNNSEFILSTNSLDPAAPILDLAVEWQKSEGGACLQPAFAAGSSPACVHAILQLLLAPGADLQG